MSTVDRPRTMSSTGPDVGKTIFFMCDIQTRFRTAIHGFEEVVATANKMLRIAQVLGCPVIVSEQNPKALGPTAPEINLEALGSLHLITVEKTLFSMVTDPILSILNARSSVESIILFGIESHVCVLQTALDLLGCGYAVYVLADGVSSCNKEEVPLALGRIAQAGGHVTSSESVAFQLMRDAGKTEFKAFSTVIKEERDETKKALGVLVPQRSSL